MHQIVCQLGFDPDQTRELPCSAPPDHLAGLGGGAPGKEKEGGEGEMREGKG